MSLGVMPLNERSATVFATLERLAHEQTHSCLRLRSKQKWEPCVQCCMLHTAHMWYSTTHQSQYPISPLAHRAIATRARPAAWLDVKAPWARGEPAGRGVRAPQYSCRPHRVVFARKSRSWASFCRRMREQQRGYGCVEFDISNQQRWGQPGLPSTAIRLFTPVMIPSSWLYHYV